MLLTHRLQLNPSPTQLGYFIRAAGVARFVWNWSLTEWNRQYTAGEKPTALKLSRQFTTVKQVEFPWVTEVHAECATVAARDLGVAFSRFFAKKAKYPRFKRKGEHDSFYVHNACLRVDEKNRVKLPKIGWVKLTESLRFSGKIMGARVTRQADKWFIAIQVDLGDDYRREPNPDRRPVVGVDLGVKELAVLSSGERVEGPKAQETHTKRLRRLSKSHSRKQKGSKNREKSKMKLARLHMKVGNIRKESLNLLTTKLCRENQAVVIEDLNVSGMVRNHKLARAISDMGFGEFRRQLTYKSKLYGTELIVADRWFPSSKTCSDCGTVKETLALGEREWACNECGVVHDRDLNAAMNLEQLPSRRGNVMPVEMKALVRPRKRKNETVVDEAGISQSPSSDSG